MMRAITLWQPWASALALGLKKIETRSWPTKVRGLVAIHAAKRRSEADAAVFHFMAGAFGEVVEVFQRQQGKKPFYPRLPFGRIVGYATLVDCVEFTPEFVASVSPMENAWGDFSIGRYGWIFEDVRFHREGIPCRGAQGFWNLPPAVVAQLIAEAQPA